MEGKLLVFARNIQAADACFYTGLVYGVVEMERQAVDDDIETRKGAK
jgi:hypothetical protein